MFLLPVLFLLKATPGFGAGHPNTAAEVPAFPVPSEIYKAREGASESLGAILAHRIRVCPFNLVATLIFFGAVLHTLGAARFGQWAGRLELRASRQNPLRQKPPLSVHLLRLLGETELIFGLWLLPLGLAVVIFFGKDALGSYLTNGDHYTEALFMVVIMAIAGTQPVLRFVEKALRHCARLGNGSPMAWWCTLLGVAPLLGSFITEPAAMTLTALLLARRFYPLQPSPRLAYATLGLLFVHISVGGTLSHLAAPPILMVASRWDWHWAYVFRQLGLRALLGIALSTLSGACYFRRELRALASRVPPIPPAGDETEKPIPGGVTAVHLAFLLWTIATLHHPGLFLGGFLLFLPFHYLSTGRRNSVALRQPLRVGCFLAGLVLHGGLQSWWIAPVLGKLGPTALFAGSMLLTAFNDNAALTYLASLVPEFLHHRALQNAIVAGAVCGGGLTLIANAPNPAGAALLSRFFPGGISPLRLLLAALYPTLVLAGCFRLF